METADLEACLGLMKCGGGFASGPETEPAVVTTLARIVDGVRWPLLPEGCRPGTDGTLNWKFSYWGCCFDTSGHLCFCLNTTKLGTCHRAGYCIRK